MCCQIFHNFSSVTFYNGQWGASAFRTFWPPCPQVQLASTVWKALALEETGPHWGEGRAVGCGCISVCHPQGSLHPQTRWPWLITLGDVLFISLPGLLCNKYHTLGSLSNRHLLSHCPGGWKSTIKVSAGLVLLRPLFWACGWPSSPCVLMWSSLCVCLCLDFLFLQGHLLYGITAHVSTGLIQMQSEVLGYNVRIWIWENNTAHNRLRGLLSDSFELSVSK